MVADQRQWLYFFSPLANLSASERGLGNDVGNVRFLTVQDGGSNGAASAAGSAPMEVNVWIGQPNVTTPAHFDAVHNA